MTAELSALFAWGHDEEFVFHERLPSATVYACGTCGQHRVQQDDPAAHHAAMAALADALIDAADGVCDMSDLDHALCPPGSHDFAFVAADFGPDASLQAHDMYNRLACNHCHQPMFYCERDGGWHHAGADIDPCFLIHEPGQNVTDPLYCARCGRPACGGADCRDLTDEAAAENKRLAAQARLEAAATGVMPPIGQPDQPDATAIWQSPHGQEIRVFATAPDCWQWTVDGMDVTDGEAHTSEADAREQAHACTDRPQGRYADFPLWGSPQ